MPISRGLATLHDMQTWYSLRDAFDLYEIVRVDAWNREQWEKMHDHP